METTEEIQDGPDLELVPLEDLIAEAARRHDGFVAAGFQCTRDGGAGHVQTWCMGDDDALAIIAETVGWSEEDTDECDEP